MVWQTRSNKPSLLISSPPGLRDAKLGLLPVSPNFSDDVSAIVGARYFKFTIRGWVHSEDPPILPGSTTEPAKKRDAKGIRERSRIAHFEGSALSEDHRGFISASQSPVMLTVPVNRNLLLAALAFNEPIPVVYGIG